MFIHDSLDTGAFSLSPALYTIFNVPPDPRGPTAACWTHPFGEPIPLWCVLANDNSNMLVAAVAVENDSSLADVQGHYFENSGFEVFLVLRPRELHGLLVFERGHLLEGLLD